MGVATKFVTYIQFLLHEIPPPQSPQTVHLGQRLLVVVKVNR